MIYMPREDSRTYITERVEGMVDILDAYRVTRESRSTYLGRKFDQCIVFEHEDGMFKIIDWGDRDHPSKMECEDIIKEDKCQYVLKCQYSPKWHVPKLRPFFYFEKTKPKEFSASLSKLRAIPKSSDKLYWRGNPHMGRGEVLAHLTDLLFEGHESLTDLRAYYEETASHKMALSLPGLGKSCHRDFECFALGTVVVAPLFQNLHHSPLLPDVHYAAVRCETSSPEDLAQAVRKRATSLTWEDLARIRKNAMDYYDEFIRYESSVKWMKHLLEL